MRGVFLGLFLFITVTVVADNSMFSGEIKTKGPKSFLISNESNDDKVISINGDGGFFSDLKELISFINKRYNTATYPFDYQKAWRFMVDYTWTTRLPLTHQEWYHNALVFINSAGWGFCDDKAIILAKIWLAMGYESRVCYLNGHVVPEIFFQNKWEMWDPTYHVFYKDSNNNVLGVENLFKNSLPVSTIHNDKRMTLTLWAKKMGFSKKTEFLYHHNDKFNFFYPTSDNVNCDFSEFLLPKGAFMIFPVYKKYPLKSNSFDRTRNQTDFAQLMLYIEPGWTGQISYPLIFHAINSSGADVIINKKKIILNKERKNVVREVFSPQDTIEITHNNKGVSLYFLINPRLFSGTDNFKNIRQKLESDRIQVRLIKTPFINRHKILYMNETEMDKGQTYLKIMEYFLKRLFI